MFLGGGGGAREKREIDVSCGQNLYARLALMPQNASLFYTEVSANIAGTFDIELPVQVMQNDAWQKHCCVALQFLRWLPPVLHFPEPLNFTKGFLAHQYGLVLVLARWCYNSF